MAEGHAPTREFLEQALRGAGYDVTAFADAEHAFEKWAEKRFELAVVAADLSVDGSPHLAVRIHGADPRALVIATDRSHLGMQAVLAIKANAYVADPTSRELLEKVKQLLEQSELAHTPAPAGVSLVLSRAPSAQGRLEPGKLARALHTFWRTFRDGIVVLRHRGISRRIFLLRGAPVNCDSDDRAESLGRWLVEIGRITEAQYQAALEAMAQGGLSPGAGLVAVGALEAGEALYGAIRDHLKAMVARAVAMREGQWTFHAGGEFSTEVPAIEASPLSPLLEGARAAWPVKFFAGELQPMQKSYPARAAEFGKLLPLLELGTADLRRALALDGRSTTREFLAGRRDLKETYALLWFLSLVGGVAFHPWPAAEGGAPLPPAGKGWKRKLPADQATEIREAALSILPGSYFKALGLDIGAGQDDVERAFREAAARWNPEGFAEFDLGDSEELLVQLHDKVSAAYRVLSLEEKRKAYLAYLYARQDELPRRGGVDVDAEIALKRGEKALRERRFAEAVAEFRTATEKNPREPEYLAMLAFATLNDPGLLPEERPKAARRLARKALALNPDHPRATVSLALAEDAAGESAEARRRLLGYLKSFPSSEVAKKALQRLNRPKR